MQEISSNNDKNDVQRAKTVKFNHIQLTPNRKRRSSGRFKIVKKELKNNAVDTSSIKPVNYLRNIFSPRSTLKTARSIDLVAPRIVITKPSPVRSKINIQEGLRYHMNRMKITSPNENATSAIHNNNIVGGRKSRTPSPRSGKKSSRNSDGYKNIVSPVVTYIQDEMLPTKKYIPFKYLGSCRTFK